MVTCDAPAVTSTDG